MKAFKILVIAIVALFTFGSAKAQVRVRATIGGGGYHRHYVHRRVVVVHRPYHHYYGHRHEVVVVRHRY